MQLKIRETLFALMDIHLKKCNLYGFLTQKVSQPLQYALTQIYLGGSHVCRLLFLAILGRRKKGLRNDGLTFILSLFHKGNKFFKAVLTHLLLVIDTVLLFVCF